MGYVYRREQTPSLCAIKNSNKSRPAIFQLSTRQPASSRIPFLRSVFEKSKHISGRRLLVCVPAHHACHVFQACSVAQALLHGLPRRYAERMISISKGSIGSLCCMCSRASYRKAIFGIYLQESKRSLLSQLCLQGVRLLSCNVSTSGNICVFRLL